MSSNLELQAQTNISDAVTQCSSDTVHQSSIRDEKGRILPGCVLPTPGRPKTRHISEALRDSLESGDAVALAQRWLEIAKTGKPSVANAAITAIADRVEGKPMQQMRVESSIDDNTARRIAELYERLSKAT